MNPSFTTYGNNLNLDCNKSANELAEFDSKVEFLDLESIISSELNENNQNADVWFKNSLGYQENTFSNFLQSPLYSSVSTQSGFSSEKETQLLQSVVS